MNFPFLHNKKDLIHCDDVILAQKWLAEGMDPNTKDDNGKSALANAVRYQLKEKAFILLGNGADPNSEAWSGSNPNFTVLMEAAQQGDLPMVYALLAAGAEIDHQSSIGLTPLMCAAETSGTRKAGCLAIIKVLLAAGADPNRQAKEDLGYGMTALIKAASGGCLEIVEALLAHGADPNTKDYIGMTAYNHAVHHGYQKVADLLVKNGADPSAFTASLTGAEPKE